MASARSTIALEALLQRDIPSPALSVSGTLVIAVFESAGDERRLLIEYIVHPKGDCGVSEPCAPAARIVLRCRHRNNVLILSILHLRALAAFLSIPRDFILLRRYREV